MTDTSLNLNLSELKTLYRSTLTRFEMSDYDPTIDKRALYRELKSLQYEISMKEAEQVLTQER